MSIQINNFLHLHPPKIYSLSIHFIGINFILIFTLVEKYIPSIQAISGSFDNSDRGSSLNDNFNLIFEFLCSLCDVFSSLSVNFDLLKLRFGFYYPFCQVDCMRICKQNLPLFKILSIRFNPVILIMVNTLFKIKQALYFSIVTLSHFKKSHYFMSNYRQKPIIFVSMKKFFEKLN